MRQRANRILDSTTTFKRDLMELRTQSRIIWNSSVPIFVSILIQLLYNFYDITSKRTESWMFWNNEFKKRTVCVSQGQFCGQGGGSHFLYWEYSIFSYQQRIKILHDLVTWKTFGTRKACKLVLIAYEINRIFITHGIRCRAESQFLFLSLIDSLS